MAERHYYGGYSAEVTEAVYQGSKLDNESLDHSADKSVKGGDHSEYKPVMGLAIGDAAHRQFVADLYADSGVDPYNAPRRARR